MSVAATMVRLSIFCLFLGGVGFMISGDIIKIFLTNSALNGFITCVFVFGVLFNFYRVWGVRASLAWFKEPRLEASEEAPDLVRPFARELTANKPLNPGKVDSLIEQVSLHGTTQQTLGKYLIGVLVFLGLIGTFWGLSLTIGSIGSVINTLPSAGGSGAGAGFIGQLKSGLQAPLNGMSLAFSSSLFGIAGSLILGFFDMQASTVWRRFLNHFEEQVLGAQSAPVNEAQLPQQRGNPVSGAYLQSLMSQTHETMEGMAQFLSKSELSRSDLNKNLLTLTERLSKLTDQRETERSLLIKVAEGQIEFQNQLRRFSDKITEGDFGLDAGTRNHVRNLDAALTHLVETSHQAQDAFSHDLRKELRLVAKTISQLGTVLTVNAPERPTVPPVTSGTTLSPRTSSPGTERLTSDAKKAPLMMGHKVSL